MPTPLGADPSRKYSVFFSHKVNNSGVTKALKKLLDGQTRIGTIPNLRWDQ